MEREMFARGACGLWSSLMVRAQRAHCCHTVETELLMLCTYSADGLGERIVMVRVLSGFVRVPLRWCESTSIRDTAESE